MMKRVEPTILPVRPGTLDAQAKADLRKAGVIVIEHENPAELRLIKPCADLSASDMLLAAMRGVMAAQDSKARYTFAENILKMLEDASQ